MADAHAARVVDRSGSRRSSRIEVRTDADQDELIRQAAALEHKTVTAFVLETATERARSVLAEHRDVVLSAEAFGRFTAALDEPAVVVPELAKLFGSRAHRSPP